MALPEDLDAVCTQQLFRAAEFSHLEELDDFDLVLSQTSDAELSALCTQGPALSPRDQDEKILLDLSCSAQKSKSSKCEDSAALNSCCVQRALRFSGSAILV